MEKTKADIMNHVLTKLQDVQNSQKALIEKAASIQIELFDLPDADLEGAVDTAVNTISQCAQDLNEAIERYEMKVNVENQSRGAGAAAAAAAE
jgi:hypothetical protein